MARRQLFIEGSLFVNKKQSGIGYATINMIQALCESDKLEGYDIVLLISKDVEALPPQLSQTPKLIVKKVPISSRLIRVMSRLPITPPIDLLIGRGVYIFPNFYNFSVPFSKSITFIHDVSFINYPETVQEKNREFLANNIGKWVRRSSIIATLSEAAEKQLEKSLNISGDRFIIVNVPLRREVFKLYKQRSIKGIKLAYGLPEKYILYVGNIEPRKNLERFVEAFSISKSTQNNISLVLVGADKWASSSIETRITEARTKGASIIIPKKFVKDEDLPLVIAGALFLGQPSIDEGFGIPPTQALACGIPIIVSDLPVMHEIVGKSARYFDPKNIEDMANKINAMLDLAQNATFLKKNQKIAQPYLDKLLPQSAINSLIDAML